MTLIRPLITEESLNLARAGRFSFVVERGSRSPEIRRAVEEIFGVKVTKIATGKIPGKTYRSGKLRTENRKLSQKKAIVTLEKGQKIDLFEVGEDAS